MRLLLFFALAATAYPQDKPDLSIVNRIRDEAVNRSEIMDTLFNLSDVNGPRVTNSTGFKAAADFVVKRLGRRDIAPGRTMAAGQKLFGMTALARPCTAQDQGNLWQIGNGGVPFEL